MHSKLKQSNNFAEHSLKVFFIEGRLVSYVTIDIAWT